MVFLCIMVWSMIMMVLYMKIYIVLVLEIIHSPFLTPYPGFLYWINKIRYPNGNTLILLQNSTDTIGVLFELVSNYGGIQGEVSVRIYHTLQGGVFIESLCCHILSQFI